MKLLYNRIIVKQVDNDDLERAGIVIPSTAENNLLTGEILHIGTNIEYCQVGDKILYSENSGEEIYLDSLPAKMLLETDVKAIL